MGGVSGGRLVKVSRGQQFVDWLETRSSLLYNMLHNRSVKHFGLLSLKKADITCLTACILIKEVAYFIKVDINNHFDMN